MKNWKTLVIVLVGIFAVIISSIFFVNSIKNKAFSYEEQIETAKSDIKIQEKRRAELIPNLVDCVKAYDKHEYETLMSVIDGRNLNTDSDIKEVKSMINVAVEAYPELQSSDNYKNLMNELSITENLIAKYRENYNKQIKVYRRYVRNPNTSFFLNLTGYEFIDYEYLTYDVSEDAPKNLFD